MSVVAWDGKTIAADRRAVCAGAHFTTTKIRRIHRPDRIPEVLAWTGDQDSGEMMAQWYESGANPAAFPECQKDKDAWARLIVADANGCKFYERQPVAVRVEDKFCAWGSGRDFALAALHLGFGAVTAVQVAIEISTDCGNGVDSYDL